MAKFPTEVTESVVVSVPLDQAYAFFADVPGSARCIPGIDLAPDTPVPRLLQGFIKSYVEGEATTAARGYLANVAARLGGVHG